MSRPTFRRAADRHGFARPQAGAGPVTTAGGARSTSTTARLACSQAGTGPVTAAGGATRTTPQPTTDGGAR